jgi:hypothetical protein
VSSASLPSPRRTAKQAISLFLPPGSIGRAGRGRGPRSGRVRCERQRACGPDDAAKLRNKTKRRRQHGCGTRRRKSRLPTMPIHGDKPRNRRFRRLNRCEHTGCSMSSYSKNGLGQIVLRSRTGHHAWAQALFQRSSAFISGKAKAVVLKRKEESMRPVHCARWRFSRYCCRPPLTPLRARDTTPAHFIYVVPGAR